MTDKISYEWRIVHNGVGKTPNIRTNGTSWLYKNNIWLACGASAGYGKTAEVWRFSLDTKEWNKVDATGMLISCFLFSITCISVSSYSLTVLRAYPMHCRWPHSQRWEYGYIRWPWQVCFVRRTGVPRTEQKAEQNVGRKSEDILEKRGVQRYFRI